MWGILAVSVLYYRNLNSFLCKSCWLFVQIAKEKVGGGLYELEKWKMSRFEYAIFSFVLPNFRYVWKLFILKKTRYGRKKRIIRSINPISKDSKI